MEDTSKFNRARIIEPIISKKSGKITQLDANLIGEMSRYLGAGRLKKDDLIDMTVGFVFNKKVGDIVEEGEILGYIHGNDEEKVEYVLNQELFEII